MRICFFNTTKAWGGGEKWHLETARYMSGRGYAVELWGHRDGELAGRSVEAGLTTRKIAAGNLSFLNPLRVIRLRNAFARADISVLVLNLSRDLKLAGLAGKLAGIPRIIYRRGSDIPVRNTFLNRWLMGNVLTDILVNSKATATSLLSKNENLFPKDQIRIIYNGIPRIGRVKPALPATSKIRLVNLGRLEYQKNQIFLLEVARILQGRGLDFELRIGGIGRLQEELQQAIEKEQLRDRVFLDGFIEDPIAYVASGDIFLLSSRWEGFGYVLAEAGRCGVPVVAFSVSSNPEIVPQGKAGYLTPPDDAVAFADAVEKLGKQEEKRRQMGAFAQQFVDDHFNLDDRLRETENFLVHGK